jgi:hypothetical protein
MSIFTRLFAGLGLSAAVFQPRFVRVLRPFVCRPHATPLLASHSPTPLPLMDTHKLETSTRSSEGKKRSCSSCKETSTLCGLQRDCLPTKRRALSTRLGREQGIPMLPRRGLRPARPAMARPGMRRSFHDRHSGKPISLGPLIAGRRACNCAYDFLRAGSRRAEEGNCSCRLCQFYLLGERLGFLSGDRRRAGT